MNIVLSYITFAYENATEQSWIPNFGYFTLSIQTNYVVISIYLLYIFVVTTGVTILLSLTVFLNLVAETLPQVSDAIPLLGTF